eukprot:scaffold21900_cov67-Phaeocystis_antarctica.AAC.2
MFEKPRQETRVKQRGLPLDEPHLQSPSVSQKARISVIGRGELTDHAGFPCLRPGGPRLRVGLLHGRKPPYTLDGWLRHNWRTAGEGAQPLVQKCAPVEALKREVVVGQPDRIVRSAACAVPDGPDQTALVNEPSLALSVLERVRGVAAGIEHEHERGVLEPTASFHCASPEVRSIVVSDHGPIDACVER